MATEELPQPLEDAILVKWQNGWFIHNAAPAHFTCVVEWILKSPYPTWWLGWNGQVLWSPWFANHTPAISIVGPSKRYISHIKCEHVGQAFVFDQSRCNNNTTHVILEVLTVVLLKIQFFW